MRLVEIFEKEQVEEGKVSNALAAGTLAAASMLPSHMTSSRFDIDPGVKPQYQQELLQREREHRAREEREQYMQSLVDTITSKYKVSKQLASHVVQLADKYAKPTFPKAADILAIVGIESSFDPKAVSGLRHDPAIGLMQVRPRTWNVSPREVKHSTDAQIQLGSDILNKYYNRLGSKKAAVHAYNVGLHNLLTGKKTNPGYVRKYENELAMYM